MILNAHPGISEGAVLGVPESGRPENDIPVAYVVRLDSSLTEKDVTDFVNARVSHFKQLRRVTFVETLPKVGHFSMLLMVEPIGKVVASTNS